MLNRFLIIMKNNRASTQDFVTKPSVGLFIQIMLLRYICGHPNIDQSVRMMSDQVGIKFIWLIFFFSVLGIKPSPYTLG